MTATTPFTGFEECEYCHHCNMGKQRAVRLYIRRYILWSYRCPWDCPCLNDLDTEYRSKILTEKLDCCILMGRIMVDYHEGVKTGIDIDNEVEEIFNEMSEYIDKEKILTTIQECRKNLYKIHQDRLTFFQKIENILLEPPPEINIKKA